MEQISIVGGRPLTGSVPISGSKNGTLPLLAAALLVEGETVLENVPQIEDVHTMLQMLQALGVKSSFLRPGTLRLDATDLRSVEAPYELVRKMRGSFYVAGPLLARFGHAEVPLPGGCVIGSRPVDQHIHGFEALGAQVEEDAGVMRAQATRLRGARIYLDARSRSVGATINIMLAAVLAEGTTVIESASREPEVVACGEFLRACGAQVSGLGTATVVIRGVPRLHETQFRSIPDRMEAGTFMYATAVTGGDTVLEAVAPEPLAFVTECLRSAGVQVQTEPGAIRVCAEGRPRPVDIVTAPYPGFPTDLQPCHGVLCCLAKGTSILEETMFEARFTYTDELARMGADIRVVGRAAIIKGIPRLSAAPVEASDIRAGAALVLAGLGAEGRTEVAGAEYIDRGYERLVEKLQGLGAAISRSGAGGRQALCLA